MRDALRKHLELQPTSLIFFFMPDCGSCQEIKPEILKFAKNKKLPLFQKMKVKHPYMGLEEIREIISLES